MKIGVFDSGLGGLYLLRSMLRNRFLSNFDFVFLGDTKNLPYGEKSQKQIYRLTTEALEFLFGQGCSLVVVACNTASAQALRKIQREFLPKYFPGKKVLGVIRPTVEMVGNGDVLVLATTATVKAHAYTKEFQKFHPGVKVFEVAAPELVPLIEAGNTIKLGTAVAKYALLYRRSKVRNVILGCTHYAVIKHRFAKKLKKGVKLISQDEIVPFKLADYLERHREVENKLSKRNEHRFYVTKLSMDFSMNAKKWFGKKINLFLTKY